MASTLCHPLSTPRESHCLLGGGTTQFENLLHLSLIHANAHHSVLVAGCHVVHDVALIPSARFGLQRDADHFASCSCHLDLWEESTAQKKRLDLRGRLRTIELKSWKRRQGPLVQFHTVQENV